jgi:hypothetical protein
MTTTMVALDSPNIRYSEFIRLTMPSVTYTFCSAATAITVNGITFTGLGDLLSISNIAQNVKSTSQDLTISLTGIDGSNTGMVLSADIKGSVVEIWRGFLDTNNQIMTIGGVQQFFKRYQGIVNNVSIQEGWNEEARTRIATCSVACASFKVILQNRISGQKTTPVLWQTTYPNDTSMNRVPVITAQYFDFGKEPQGGGQATPSTPATYTSGTFG